MLLACVAAMGQRPRNAEPGQRNRPTETGATTPPGSPSTPTPPSPIINIAPIATKHTIQLRGQAFSYTATAGTLPIRNDDGEIEGRIFFVAYTKDGEDATKRPVTFAYNGGPGSSSVWLHLGVLGPRRVALNDDGSMPAPPFQLVDNQETWLESTDVVMIDAMGTGFSRPLNAEVGKKFYGLQGDLQGFGEFIRTYLTKYRRMRSPLFLAGESYGGIRTAGLSGYLLQRGIALNGAVIISGVENYLTLDAGRGNDVPYITFLPTYSATAFYHKKLSSKYKDLDTLLGQVEKFAEGEYANALFRGNSISDTEKKKVAAKISEYTGLSETYVLRSNLRISEFRFFKELLRDEGKVVGRYDARLTGQDGQDIGDGPEFDPSDAAITPPFNQLISDYLPTELGIDIEEKYRLNNYGTGWDYGRGGNGFPDTSENLRQALQRNPHMKLMFVCGRFDLACPYFAQWYTVRHLDLRPDQLARISYSYYPAGHMVYIEKNSREKLKKDIDAFFKSAANK